MIQDILRTRYADCLKGLDIYENRGSLILSRIIVNDECRGQGVGTKIMKDLVDYADHNGQIVALTPSSDFGGSKNRLVQFYKRFGFKMNKGANKDYEFRDTMIRYPLQSGQKRVNEVGEANLEPFPYDLKGKFEEEFATTYYNTTFDSTNGTKHIVDVNVEHDENLMDIAFAAFGSDSKLSTKVVTNTGEMMKVMSTIIHIIKTIKEKHPDIERILYSPSTRGPQDTAREKLYAAFVKKHLPNATIEKYDDDIVVTINESTEKLEGGLADGMNITDLAKHHDVPVKEISSQLVKGIKVELEHTKDDKVAKEVAMDHLYEDPKYYTKLEKVEETRTLIKKLLKEAVDLSVTDETPDNMVYDIIYNGRRAGIIGCGKSPAGLDDQTLEITEFKLENAYQNINTANQAVRSLWQAYPDAQRLIVNIPESSAHFWGKLGFQRLNDSFYQLMRGH